MRAFKDILETLPKTEPQEKSGASRAWDEKTIFFVFGKVVREQYGRQGSLAIYPFQFSGGILSLRVTSPLWANELLMQESTLCAAVNTLLEGEVVKQIRVLHGKETEKLRSDRQK